MPMKAANNRAARPGASVDASAEDATPGVTVIPSAHLTPARPMDSADARLRAVLRLGSFWYWELDAECRFISSSFGRDEQAGARAHDRIGKAAWEVGQFADSDAAFRRWKATLLARKPFRDVVHFRKSVDGQLRWVRTHGEPIFDEHGRFHGYHGLSEDITEHVSAEHRYRELVEQSPDGTMILCDGRIVYANQAAATLFQVPNPSDLVGRRALEFVHPAQHEEVVECLSTVLRDRVVPPALELRVLGLDGREAVVELSGRFLEFDGRPAIQAIARDVTERHEARHRIRRLTNLYSALSRTNEAITRLTTPDEVFDAVCRIAVEFGRFSMAGVALLDGEARRVRPVKAAGNTALFERLGVAPDAGGPAAKDPIATALRTGAPVICQDVAVEACALPWRDAMLQAGFRSSGNFPIARGGQVIGALVLYASEVEFFDQQLQELLARLTASVSFALDAMEKESDKRAARQALEDRQNALSTLLDHLPGMAFRCRSDDAWTTEFVSEGCYELTGYRPEDLVGNRRISYAEIIHPDDRARVQEEVRRAGTHRFVLRYRILTAAGETRWVWEQGQMVGTAAGGKPLLEGIIQDVTGQVTAERLLDEHRQQLLLALDATDQGLWDWNLTTGRVSLDRATARILGLGDAEVEGPGNIWFDRIHAADVGAVTDAIRNHLAGRTDRCHGEYRMCLGYGAFAWVGTSGRVIERSPDGRALRMVGTVVNIAERKRSEERLAFLAHYDELTGLPNRTLFRDRLHTAIARARRTRRQLAVMALDLHRFNQINDTLGHAVGDQILREVAQRLRSCLRDVDTIARLGGDDFTLLIEDIDHPGDLTRVAECIQNSFSLPLHVDAREVFVSASIGIALYPRDTENTDELIRYADAALYRAKGLGGNAHVFYDAEMGSRTVARLKLESELHRALERDEFVVHYQAKVSVDTLRITGAEALVRWNSRNGVISPAEFIPIAEETGLILDIGRWVMQTSCTQAMQWQRAGLPPIGVAVNLSPRQFMQRDLFETIDSVLAQTGLDPRYLEFEITESMLMHQGESVIDTLERLSAMGVRLAIDDFGTGYSSLAYLKRFPVQDIKIDRSFIRNLTEDPDDAAIVTAVAHMTRSLGLNLIAEGVETEDQLATLRRLRCDTFQGYLFSKPLPPREFAALLALDARNTDR